MTVEDIHKAVDIKAKERSEDVIMRALKYYACFSNKNRNAIRNNYEEVLKQYVNNKILLHRLNKSIYYESYSDVRISIIWNKAVELIDRNLFKAAVEKKIEQYTKDDINKASYYYSQYSNFFEFKIMSHEQQCFIVSALCVADEMIEFGINESSNIVKSGIYDLFVQSFTTNQMVKQKIQTLKSEKDKLKSQLNEAPENIYLIDVVDKLFTG